MITILIISNIILLLYTIPSLIISIRERIKTKN